MAHAYSRRAVRLPVLALAIAVLATAVLLGRGARAQAPAPAADFAYVVYTPGWNMISPGGQNDIDVESLSVGIGGPLYTFQPNDTAYETTTLSSVKGGRGYWAYFNRTVRVALNPSQLDSYTVFVPAGQCVMVGNPSTLGSARVTGAERVLTFSPRLNDYVDETLIGIGLGAWACNYTRDSTVSVAYQGDVLSASWPNCCEPTPSSLQGKGLLVFKNDSPSPVVIGFRQIDENGELLDSGDGVFGFLPACTFCPEYPPDQHPPSSCRQDAVTKSYTMAPGFYTLHIQSDASNMPDLVVSVQVDPDTQYTLCYFIPPNRK